MSGMDLINEVNRKRAAGEIGPGDPGSGGRAVGTDASQISPKVDTYYKATQQREMFPSQPDYAVVVPSHKRMMGRPVSATASRCRTRGCRGSTG